MKKLGAFIVIVLLIMVVCYSGWLSDEGVLQGIETALRTVVDWISKGTLSLIEHLKSL